MGRHCHHDALYDRPTDGRDRNSSGLPQDGSPAHKLPLSLRTMLKREEKEMKSKATKAEIRLHCVCLGLTTDDADYLFLHWEENGWTRAGKKIKDWKRCVEMWKLAGYFPSQRKRVLEKSKNGPSVSEVGRVIREYKDRVVGCHNRSEMWNRIFQRELGCSCEEAMRVLG